MTAVTAQDDPEVDENTTEETTTEEATEEATDEATEEATETATDEATTIETEASSRMAPMTTEADPTVTFAVTSADLDTLDVVPGGTTVTAYFNGNGPHTDADDPWFPENTTLPFNNVVEVPAILQGEWRVLIDAEGFEPFDETFNVTQANEGETYAIVLVPEVDTPLVADVTITIDSADEEVTTVPAGTEWSVSQGETVLDSGTLDEAVELPQTVELTDVPYGTYMITVEPSDTFGDYSAEFTVDSPTEAVEIELIPQSLVDTIVAIIIQIIQDILAGQSAT